MEKLVESVRQIPLAEITNLQLGSVIKCDDGNVYRDNSGWWVVNVKNGMAMYPPIKAALPNQVKSCFNTVIKSESIYFVPSTKTILIGDHEIRESCPRRLSSIDSFCEDLGLEVTGVGTRTLHRNKVSYPVFVSKESYCEVLSELDCKLGERLWMDYKGNEALPEDDPLKQQWDSFKVGSSASDVELFINNNLGYSNHEENDTLEPSNG